MGNTCDTAEEQVEVEEGVEEALSRQTDEGGEGAMDEDHDWVDDNRGPGLGEREEEHEHKKLLPDAPTQPSQSLRSRQDAPQRWDLGSITASKRAPQSSQGVHSNGIPSAPKICKSKRPNVSSPWQKKAVAMWKRNTTLNVVAS